MIGYRFEDLRGFTTWLRLRRLVGSEPSEVLAQASVALRLSDHRLHARILAVVGTALRSIDRHSDALTALKAARERAQTVGDLWAQADILQREAVVSEFRGDYERALDLARRAAGMHASLGDQAGVGRATLEQGVFLALMGRLEEAALLFRRALRLLPFAETNHRFAALCNLAQIHSELGDLGSALEYSRAAALASEKVGELHLAKRLRIKGELELKLGKTKEAEDSFSQAAEAFRSRSAFLECAEATIWLCRSLVADGRPLKAVRVARASAQLIGHLRGNRVAGATIAELAAQATAGRRLTEAFLGRAARRLGALAERQDARRDS